MSYQTKAIGSRRLHLLVLQPGESRMFKLDSSSDPTFTLYASNQTPDATLALDGALCQPSDFDVPESDGWFQLSDDVPAGESGALPPGQSAVRYIRASLSYTTLGKAVVQVLE